MVLSALGAQVIDVGPELQPLVDTIQPFFGKLSVLVGGLFGLYIILILVRIYYERKKVKILRDIRYDMDHLNRYHGISYSRHRMGLPRKTFNVLRGLVLRRKVIKSVKKLDKKRARKKK
ncbi:hypothetical protein HOL21_00035 [Candidatus Woesearchaeota archaeon]|jgi:hypothetical protein|nr:hypothetical protein [Candidatus Woesearchaeota archaeon]MBT5396589.1 hypothetical protein [Candidatus Woesearchaeota archaeon]MBT6367983.1 hypothetical protein [Candidatus Woesearchaeota archaeon]MBT7762245.1 hypothetical protein [Candidatus Woesearchaeota archaeon]